MTIDDYLAQRYTLTLQRDSDDKGHSGFVAGVAELPGCVAQGATEPEAIDHLYDAMRAWLDVALSSGADIPLPREDSDYSGRVLLRLPVSLHAELARTAEVEGTSLNQLMVGALAGAVGWRVPGSSASSSRARGLTSASG
jgi:antitoxin HicB